MICQIENRDYNNNTVKNSYKIKFTIVFLAQSLLQS